MAFPWLARGGLLAHKVRRLYLFWSNQPNARVDISTTIGRKLEALRAHESQIQDLGRVEEWLSKWAEEEGAAIGVAGAEPFRVIVIDEDGADDQSRTASEAEPEVAAPTGG